jgi:hypothetical protein
MEIRNLTDADLAALYATANEELQEALLDEAARRDRKARQHAREAARWARIREEWELFAHAQYLAADAETRGNLLSRAGIEAGITEWSLWSGSWRSVEKYASEELRNFWDANPRMTVNAYWEQSKQQAKAARADRFATAA